MGSTPSTPVINTPPTPAVDLGKLDRKIGDTLQKELRPDQPPRLNILVVGLIHSGKSSFINTVLRVLNEEQKELFKARALPGTASGSHTTLVYESFGSHLPRWDHIRLYDTKAPRLGDDGYDKTSESFFLKATSTGLLPCLKDMVLSDATVSAADKINSFVFVVCPEHVRTKDFYTAIDKIYSLMRLYNTKPIVVLTNIDRMDYKEIQIMCEELKRICDSLQVYPLQNYTIPKNANDIPPQNFKTDNTVVNILDACFIQAENIMKCENVSKKYPVSQEKN